MKTFNLHCLKNYIFAASTAAMLSACGVNSSIATPPELQETSVNQEASTLSQYEWRLMSLQGAKVGKGADGRMVSMNFNQETNRVSGYAGCNNYFSSFTVEGESLSIGALGMTRRFCEKKADLESRFSKMLTHAKFYQIDQDKLLLMDNEKNVTATLIKGS